jgi:hypothetical protein
LVVAEIQYLERKPEITRTQNKAAGLERSVSKDEVLAETDRIKI